MTNTEGKQDQCFTGDERMIINSIGKTLEKVDPETKEVFDAIIKIFKETRRKTIEVDPRLGGAEVNITIYGETVKLTEKILGGKFLWMNLKKDETRMLSLRPTTFNHTQNKKSEEGRIDKRNIRKIKRLLEYFRGRLAPIQRQIEKKRAPSKISKRYLDS